MFFLDPYLSYIETHLQQHIKKEPKNLYEPLSYFLKLGGKRIRPIICLMVTSLFKGNLEKALPAALSIEYFHNFSLIHDDIMDKAPLRRNKPTVHNLWNTNTAILSGDVLLISAYRFLESYASPLQGQLLKLFNKTAKEVCEGQQLDMDFEKKKNVSLNAYMEMIRLKTSVLLATSFKIGALIAEKSEEIADKLYNYGVQLGLAYQLQDDYLDLYGKTHLVGKQRAGDIIENKKTYFYVSFMAEAHQEDKKKLQKIYQEEVHMNAEDKIKTVIDLFNRYDLSEKILIDIENYIIKANHILQDTIEDPKIKASLEKLQNHLLKRLY